MRYDPIMCMMVDDSVKTKDGIGDIINYKGYKLERVTPKDVVIYKNGKRIDLAFKYPKSFKEAKERIDNGEFDSVKTQDELSLSQKKQVVTELKGFLKKSYNFSDESEYARAYEDLRHMFTTGSRKSISGLFENAVKKTGAHDSSSALDKAIKTADGATGDKLYADVKAIYNLFSNILLTYSNEQSVQKLANEGTKKCLELAAKVKGVRDEAIRNCDRVTVKYDDAIGDTHTFFKESEEEAKKWIDQGKFPHGAAFNVKIDGKLYKKEAR